MIIMQKCALLSSGLKQILVIQPVDKLLAWIFNKPQRVVKRAEEPQQITGYGR